MHIHLPKPLHGWREFLGEVNIIVVGILIALSAEYLIEQHHWSKQAGHSDEAVKSELADGAAILWERLAVQPCLRDGIKELAEQLDRNETRWTAFPAMNTGSTSGLVLAAAYRAPIRSMTSDAWKRALADGSLNHLPAERIVEYSGIYAAMASFMDLQREEGEAAARLSPLSTDRVLDGRARLDMLRDLANVDRISSLMALIAQQSIDSVSCILAFLSRKLHDSEKKFSQRNGNCAAIASLICRST